MSEEQSKTYVRWFRELRSKDAGMVGGKNSSLGEMTSQLSEYGIPIPPGFATTSRAYWDHIEGSGLKFTIKSELELLDSGKKCLADVGRTIRKAISSAPLPPDLETSICDYYAKLCEICKDESLAVAVRSSATAEDLPEASFAGVSKSHACLLKHLTLIVFLASDFLQQCYPTLANI